MSILNNTARLQGILETVNALPEAGSGDPVLQDKIITPTTSVQTVNADEGYDGLDTVTVNAMPTATRANTTITTTADDANDKLTITASNNQTTGYVTGANKTATTTITLSASGATVTASDGTNKVSKSVATATQATPSVSIDANGKITASATQTAGYVAAGTKSATKQLTTQAAKTVTPTESAQTAVNSGIYTTGAVSVGAIPSEYIVRNEISEQDVLISNIMSALEGKVAGGGGNSDEDKITILNSLGCEIIFGMHAIPNGGSLVLPYQGIITNNKFIFIIHDGSLSNKIIYMNYIDSEGTSCKQTALPFAISNIDIYFNSGSKVSLNTVTLTGLTMLSTPVVVQPNSMIELTT